jgi:hypothetical protein
MKKKLWIINKVDEVSIPEQLSTHSQIVPFSVIGAEPGIYLENKKLLIQNPIFDVIITYEENSERIFGGSNIKLQASFFDVEFSWVTFTLTEDRLREFIRKHWNLQEFIYRR